MRRAMMLVPAVAAALALGIVHPAAGLVDGISTPLATRDDVEYVTGRNGTTGGHVVVEGDRLYLGVYGLGMKIFDVSHPADPVEIGAYLPGLRADAVPDAAVFGGRHIAVLNGTRRQSRGPDELRTDKSEFLDVTDPADPRLLWTFVGPGDGEAHNGDIFDERRLWLPSGGLAPNGLRIYDLRPVLQEPPQAPAIVFRGDPVELWRDSPHRRHRDVGKPFTHTHDVTIYPAHPVLQRDGSIQRRDIILLAEGGSYLDDDGNTGSVFVIDITEPDEPVVLLRWLHERGPGHTPIRYHHEAQLVHGHGNLMLVTDEDLHNGCGSAGGAYAVRLSPDLTRANKLSEWFIPFGTPAPVCSVHVFSSYRKEVYIGSYNAGLQVVDYSDPRDPQRIGHYIPEGSTAWGALYHGGVVYLGDMTRGLDVLRFTGSVP